MSNKISSLSFLMKQFTYIKLNTQHSNEQRKAKSSCAVLDNMSSCSVFSVLKLIYQKMIISGYIRVSQNTWKLSNKIAHGNPGSFWHKRTVWFFSRILGDCYLVSFYFLFLPILGKIAKVAKNGDKNSQGSSLLKFLKKIRPYFYVKRNQDFHVQLHLTTFMFFGTPYLSSTLIILFKHTFYRKRILHK